VFYNCFIFPITVSLFLFRSVVDTLVQFPQLNIKDKNALSLNVTDAVYNANTSEFLGSKNISLTPYRITKQHYFDERFLNNVGNVTNSQTFLNTYMMIYFLGEEMERLRLLMEKISVGYLPT
jgi:hypothetical protein